MANEQQQTLPTVSTLFSSLASIEHPPQAENFEAMYVARSELIPLLLHEVDAFASSPDAVAKQGDAYIRHTLSMFLLAYFREQQAFPKIIRLISLPNKQVMDLTGEVFSEALGRILASVYDGNLQMIQDVVENQRLNPWIRSGALDSLMVLWKEGVLSREKIMTYLQALLSNKLEKKASYVWDAVALIAYDLHPQALEQELRSAMQQKLIEPVVLNDQSLADCLAQPFTDTLQQKTNIVDGYIKSPTDELSWWLYPDRKLLQKGKDYESLDVPIVDKDVTPGERVAPMGWRSATVVRGAKKVGRNEPCICGSGKKYKKCCIHL